MSYVNGSVETDILDTRLVVDEQRATERRRLWTGKLGNVSELNEKFFIRKLRSFFRNIKNLENVLFAAILHMIDAVCFRRHLFVSYVILRPKLSRYGRMIEDTVLTLGVMRLRKNVDCGRTVGDVSVLTVDSDSAGFFTYGSNVVFRQNSKNKKGFFRKLRSFFQ